jgi:hypothetical protein
MFKKSTLSAVLIAMVAITSSAVLVVSETTRRDGRTAFAAAPTSQANLALLPQDTNRPSEAEPLFRRGLAIDEMPSYMFNAFGASLDWIARDRALLGDTAAAMIEAPHHLSRQGKGPDGPPPSRTASERAHRLHYV